MSDIENRNNHNKDEETGQGTSKKEDHTVSKCDSLKRTLETTNDDGDDIIKKKKLGIAEKDDGKKERNDRENEFLENEIIQDCFGNNIHNSDHNQEEEIESEEPTKNSEVDQEPGNREDKKEDSHTAQEKDDRKEFNKSVSEITSSEYFNSLNDVFHLHHKAGSSEFMKIFTESEKQHMNNGDVIFTVVEHDQKFSKIRCQLENTMQPEIFKNIIFLIKNKHDFGIEVPEDLDFETVDKYINHRNKNRTEKKFVVIDSLKADPISMTLPELIEAFAEKVEKREKILNLLSLEFSVNESRLANEFKLPEYVESISMVDALDKSLEIKLKQIKETLRNKLGNHQKSYLEARRKKLKFMKDNLPRYEKFLLLSMKNSFTDAHVDPSGTSVYYHVKKGRKIFYVAPPTEANLAIYAKSETRSLSQWIGSALADQWTRVEINTGDTAIIPSGYIHMVYTPEDSIVLGGNFLQQNHIDRQFRFTKLEEDAVENDHLDRDNLIRGYRDIMFSYIENIFIDTLNNFPGCNIPQDLKYAWAVFTNELKDPKQYKSMGWYTRGEEQIILANLEAFAKKSDNRINQAVRGQYVVPKFLKRPSKLGKSRITNIEKQVEK